MERGQREAVPQPDPTPTPANSTVRRFWRLFRLLALFAVVVAAIAVLLVMRGEEGVHIHMLIATALGAGLTVLVGAALMTLVFLSASSGHDDAAATHHDEGSDEE